MKNHPAIISVLIILIFQTLSCAPAKKISYNNNAETYFFFQSREESSISLMYTNTSHAKGAAIGSVGGALACFDVLSLYAIYPPILAICAGTGAVTGAVKGAKVTHQADAPLGMIEYLQSSTILNEVLTEVVKKSSSYLSKKVAFMVGADKWDPFHKKDQPNNSFVEVGPNKIVFLGGDRLYGEFKLSIRAQTKAWLSGYEDGMPHIKNFDCISDGHSLIEWGENDYSHLKNATSRCIDNLSLQIIKYYIESPSIYPSSVEPPINITPTDMSPKRTSNLGYIKVKYETALLSEPGWSGDMIERIDLTTELEAILETDLWVYVETTDGKRGWIAKKWIQN